MSPEDCCVSSGELRQVVEDVAEKAANRAVDTMYYRLKADFADMEKRMSADFSEAIDAKIHDALGMTIQDHIIQHDRMRRMSNFFTDLNGAFWKKYLAIILIAGLAFFTGTTADLKTLTGTGKVEKTVINRDENHTKNEEDDHVSDE